MLRIIYCLVDGPNITGSVYSFIYKVPVHKAALLFHLFIGQRCTVSVIRPAPLKKVAVVDFSKKAIAAEPAETVRTHPAGHRAGGVAVADHCIISSAKAAEVLTIIPAAHRAGGVAVAVRAAPVLSAETAEPDNTIPAGNVAGGVAVDDRAEFIMAAEAAELGRFIPAGHRAA